MLPGPSFFWTRVKMQSIFFWFLVNSLIWEHYVTLILLLSVRRKKILLVCEQSAIFYYKNDVCSQYLNVMQATKSRWVKCILFSSTKLCYSIVWKAQHFISNLRQIKMKWQLVKVLLCMFFNWKEMTTPEHGPSNFGTIICSNCTDVKN